MLDKYFTVNIHEYFINEETQCFLDELIESFDCSIKNVEVDGFLKKSAKEFAKKGQAATYLVFANEDNPVFVGYFTLAIKPITIPKQLVSSKNARKFERVCRLNEEEGTYHFSAFLIAQIGKNYNIAPEDQIMGKELLEIAEGEIARIKVSVGGIAAFLECEKDSRLISFYENANYKYFGERISIKKENSTLYLKYIKTI